MPEKEHSLWAPVEFIWPKVYLADVEKWQADSLELNQSIC